MVAVIGVPNEQFGEEVYKYPRVVRFMFELPLSATGKILKKEIKKIV